MANLHLPPSELRIAWFVKMNNPLVKKEGDRSLLGLIARETGVTASMTRHALRKLEEKCVVLRTYEGVKKNKFQEGGSNPLIRVEMVDPHIYLPPLTPTPLAVIVARDNEDLAERAAHEPTVDQVVDALINRALELQSQINKLQGVVEALSVDNERLKKSAKAATPQTHLSSRVQDVLPPETWDRLRGK